MYTIDDTRVKGQKNELYLWYASSAAKKKTAESPSALPTTPATASVCTGCSANISPDSSAPCRRSSGTTVAVLGIDSKGKFKLEFWLEKNHEFRLEIPYNEKKL